MNQFALNNMINAPMQKMVHHSVPEIGGKNFPFNGFVDDKSYTGIGHILTLSDYFSKLQQVMFKVELKSKLIPSVSLVLARSVIGLKQSER
jgi:hypothetical protein